MFSEVQRNYIQQLVLANKADYPYYLAFTNTNISGNPTQDAINFYVVLSKSAITGSSRYNYTIPDSSVCYAVRSGNASYNYHAERVTSQSIGSSVNVNNYEWVYTNAEFESVALQPDLLITQGVQQSHFDGFGIALLVIIVGVIFAKMFRGGGGYAKI